MPAKRGSEANPIFFKSGAEYRAWLEKNHDKAQELWIGYWKKSTGKPSLTWNDTSMNRYASDGSMASGRASTSIRSSSA
jgi:hypothetical protein